MSCPAGKPTRNGRHSRHRTIRLISAWVDDRALQRLGAGLSALMGQRLLRLAALPIQGFEGLIPKDEAMFGPTNTCHTWAHGAEFFTHEFLMFTCQY